MQKMKIAPAASGQKLVNSHVTDCFFVIGAIGLRFCLTMATPPPQHHRKQRIVMLKTVTMRDYSETREVLNHERN